MNEAFRHPSPVPVPVLRQPPCPLAATRFQLEIVDLLATLRLEQDYVNREAEAIEVSYTLALPIGSQLLDFEAQIGERVLRGKVEARAVAETRYEDALAQGHSAFSIKLVDDHLLNIALGNLLPGEKLVLRLKLAQWLNCNDRRVRLVLPTTIAPRYGVSRLQPQEQPETSLTVEHGFTLEAQVSGLLASAEVSSPSHRLGMRAGPQGLALSITSGKLDGDIVLDLLSADALSPMGRLALDRDGLAAAMISFCAPQLTTPREPVLAEFVLDCSGSMAGISIQQARAALLAILTELQPEDRANVLCFGSSHRFLLRRPQPLTPLIRNTLQAAAQDLQADLGGTELMSALNAALEDLAKLPAELRGERILFIISDGEVWNPETSAFLARCAALKVRVFAVAVGTAAVEATFLPLTTATGGALERVLPGDAMAARIQRHFQRARGGLLRELSVRWPGQPGWCRGPQAVYAGDGVVLSAGEITGLEPGAARALLRWVDAAGQAQESVLALGAAVAGSAGPDDVARMLAAERLQDLAGDAAIRSAIAYQLITPQTALTLVLQREASAQLHRLPELRTVPHMLAAGWGGTSTDVGAAAPDADSDQCVQCEDRAYDLSVDMQAPGSPSAMSPPPPSPRMPAPAPMRPAGAVLASRKASNTGSWSLKKLFGKGQAEDSSKHEQLRSPELPELVRELTRLITDCCKQHPPKLLSLRNGNFSLDQLGARLPLAVFNRLDALAESEACDLNDGSFWLDLAWALELTHQALRRASDLETLLQGLSASARARRMVALLAS